MNNQFKSDRSNSTILFSSQGENYFAVGIISKTGKYSK